MKAKLPVELLVADMDNTLYDWVTFFASSFYAMVDVAVTLLEVPREVLLDELQAVHRAHHNSEQPFALLDTPSVTQKLGGIDRRQLALAMDPAFKAFNRSRERTLVAYPGVVSTLERIESTGCIVVAHTEASVANARFRLTKLNLTRFFRRLYATENQGAGHPAPETAARLDELSHVSPVAVHRRKPDPGLLVEICQDVGVPLGRTAYVGDSIARDVSMARAAGCRSAWAQYGTRFDRRLWDGLVRVTHWTEEDRRRATETQALYGEVQPDVVLRDGFGELLDSFEFRASSSLDRRRAS